MVPLCLFFNSILMPCDSRQEQRMKIWVWQSTELIFKEILTKEASHVRKLFLKVQILNVTRLTVNAKKDIQGTVQLLRMLHFE